MRPRRPRPTAASHGPAKPYRAAVLPCSQDSHVASTRASAPTATDRRPVVGRASVFICLATTYLLVVLAKLGVALSPPVRIAGHVAIACAVAAWYVAFAHVTNATFGRDLITTRLLA
jgi:hypothetical protein